MYAEPIPIRSMTRRALPSRDVAWQHYQDALGRVTGRTDTCPRCKAPLESWTEHGQIRYLCQAHKARADGLPCTSEAIRLALRLNPEAFTYDVGLVETQPEGINSLIRAIRIDRTPETGYPDFPTWVFAPRVSAFLDDAAAKMPAPVEFFAISLLAGAATAIGFRTWIIVNGGWVEVAKGYFGIIAPSGTKKSPAVNLALDSIYQLHESARDHHKRRTVQYKQAYKDWQSKKTSERGDEPEKPGQRHYWVSNATIESFNKHLPHTDGFLLRYDELLRLMTSQNQYRNGVGDDRQVWLEIWNPNSKANTLRVNDEEVYLEHTHISVLGGIQPAKLHKMADDAAHEDGFFPRILWTWPAEVEDDLPDDGPDPRLLEDIRALFTTLDTRLNQETEKIVLSRPGFRLYQAWYRANAKLGKQRGDPYRGIYAKLTAYAARLTLILHCLDYPEEDQRIKEVPAGTVARGLYITEYFRGQAHKILDELHADQYKPKDEMDRLLDALWGNSGDPVATTALHAAFGRNLSQRQLHAMLAKLLAEGKIEHSEGTNPRGPKTHYWKPITEKSSELDESDELTNYIPSRTLDVDELWRSVDEANR